ARCLMALSFELNPCQNRFHFECGKNLHIGLFGPTRIQLQLASSQKLCGTTGWSNLLGHASSRISELPFSKRSRHNALAPWHFCAMGCSKRKEPLSCPAFPCCS